jgi:hypothetical protein
MNQVAILAGAKNHSDLDKLGTEDCFRPTKQNAS